MSNGSAAACGSGCITEKSDMNTAVRAASAELGTPAGGDGPPICDAIEEMVLHSAVPGCEL